MDALLEVSGAVKKPKKGEKAEKTRQIKQTGDGESENDKKNRG